MYGVIFGAVYRGFGSVVLAGVLSGAMVQVWGCTLVFACLCLRTCSVGRRCPRLAFSAFCDYKNVMTENISHNIKDIQAVIAKTTKKWNRKAGDVTLVAVSKVQPDERIDAALAAGQRTFGENRVQEAYAHWESRRTDYPDLRLHLIGPLQSNKAADAVALFDVLETVDRKKIARVLGQEMEKQGRKLPCFIQVIQAAKRKAGVDPAELQQFYDYCIDEMALILRVLCAFRRLMNRRAFILLF